MQTIFKGDPNFRLLMPGGIVEVPPDQVFLQPTQLQEELQRILIDPTTGETMGVQPGLEEAQQGSEASSSEADAAPQPTNAQAASPSITKTVSSSNAQAPVSQPTNTSASAAPATTKPATNTPATNAPATSTPIPSSAPPPGGQPSSGSPANATGSVTPVLGGANVSGTPASIAGGAKPIPAGPVALNVDKQIPHSPLNVLRQGRGPAPNKSLLTAEPYEMFKYAGTAQQAGPTPKALREQSFARELGGGVVLEGLSRVLSALSLWTGMTELKVLTHVQNGCVSRGLMCLTGPSGSGFLLWVWS